MQDEPKYQQWFSDWQALQLRLAQVLVGHPVRVHRVGQGATELVGVLDGIADYTTAPRLVVVADGEYTSVPVAEVFEIEAVNA